VFKAYLFYDNLKKTEWLVYIVKKYFLTLKKKNIYFAIYKHHYSTIVNEVNIIHSSSCKICTEGITDVPKHKNSCYDHIFMIRSKISPSLRRLNSSLSSA